MCVKSRGEKPRHGPIICRWHSNVECVTMLVTAQNVLLIIKGEKKIVTLLLTFMVAMGLIWCACRELSFFSVKWEFLDIFLLFQKFGGGNWNANRLFFFFFVVLILQAKTDVCSWNNWELVEHYSLRKYLNYSNYITASVMLKRSAFETIYTTNIILKEMYLNYWQKFHLSKIPC